MQSQTEEDTSVSWSGEVKIPPPQTNKKKKQRGNVSPLAFFCRYGQVGENASAALLSALSAVGLSVKEKLGGERERGAESESEGRRMGGPWFRAGGRGGEGDICSAVLSRFSLIQLQAGRPVKWPKQTQMKTKGWDRRVAYFLSHSSLNRWN